MSAEQSLLVDIARCPVFVECKQGKRPSSDPCSRIVAVQSDLPIAEHHIPEPWSGRLAEAPILFVSSNPSINRGEEYPNWSWSETDIVDFFDNRFGGGRKPWVVDGARSLQLDGTHSGSVAFWAGVRNRATDLLGRTAVPGRDYALVEVVRCKSENEVGVREARLTCASRYLQRTVEASGATVIVTLGEKARPTVESLFGGPARHRVFGPVPIGGRDRFLASLGHPTGPDPKRWEACVGKDWMLRLSSAIAKV